MPKLRFDISVSLDGFVAGPNPSLENPLGVRGMELHEWVFGLASWREPHGEEGGEVNASSEVIDEKLASVGAEIIGRKMFSGGSGPWADDPNANGWWGDDPPFHHPVFVLTHHEREPVAMRDTTFVFVTDGIEAALERAREAAGDKDVGVSGGAEAGQQYLKAGLLDEINLSVVPTLLSSGTRLLENLGEPKLELDRVVDAPGVTHLRYRVSA